MTELLRAQVTVFAETAHLGEPTTTLTCELGPGAGEVVSKRLTHLALENAVAAQVGPVSLSAPSGSCVVDVLSHPELAQVQRSPWSDDALEVGLQGCAAAAVAQSDCFVVLSSGCPWLDSSLLVELVEALATADVALIPSTSGGYVAMAGQVCPDGLFADIPWGSPEVLAATVAKLEAAGVVCEVLPGLRDFTNLTDVGRLPSEWLADVDVPWSSASVI